MKDDKRLQRDMTERKEKTVELSLSAEEAACALDALWHYKDRLWSLRPAPGGPLRGVADGAQALYDALYASWRPGGGPASARVGLSGLTLLAEAAALLSDTLGGMKMSSSGPLGSADAAASRLCTRLVGEMRALEAGEAAL